MVSVSAWATGAPELPEIHSAHVRGGAFGGRLSLWLGPDCPRVGGGGIAVCAWAGAHPV